VKSSAVDWNGLLFTSGCENDGPCYEYEVVEVIRDGKSVGVRSIAELALAWGPAGGDGDADDPRVLNCDAADADG
jgi:hypothetical protein